MRIGTFGVVILDLHLASLLPRTLRGCNRKYPFEHLDTTPLEIFRTVEGGGGGIDSFAIRQELFIPKLSVICLLLSRFFRLDCFVTASRVDFIKMVSNAIGITRHDFESTKEHLAGLIS